MNRRVILIGVVVVLVLAAVLALSRPRPDPFQGPALGTGTTSPRGTRALVELLEATGASVGTGNPPEPDDDHDVVLELRSTLSGERLEDLGTWVRKGGTLVTTDPRSELAPPPAPGGDIAASRAVGRCEVEALARLDRLGVALPRTLDATAGAACFSDATGAALVVTAVGQGTVVALTSPEPFTNAALAEGDDAGLAVALLAPEAGTEVLVIDPTRFFSDIREAGDGTVLGAIGDGGRQAIYQVAVAFVLWGLARARRLGRPVPEELPVPLPSSDLTLAVGELLARGDDVTTAAAHLRHRARRDLGRALGLGPAPTSDELVRLVAARTDMDADTLTRALTTPLTDASDLIDATRTLDRARGELHGHLRIT